TAGAALLVTSLVNYPLPQAVGAYMVAGLAIALLGLSGLFGRVMALIPQPIVLGLLAGILLKFGIGIFTNLPKSPVMVVTLLVVFFVLLRLKFRAPTLVTLVVGMAIALISHELHFENVSFGLTVPQLIMPEFTVNAILALSLPLVALALTSQYATGLAVLRSFGYVPPVNGILFATGLSSVVTAFFGGHGQSLGALTAAMVMTPEVQPDLTRRYAAAVAFGGWYIVFGIFGATIISVFAGFPAALVATVAGLALSGTIGSALAGAMAEPRTREAALVTFMCCAGDFTLFSIGAPFWGLVAGMIVYLILSNRPQTTTAA
ncbi:MAG TPA: benzoate/H(+) symporter BenE family transporter, partial [Phototrophicaceae bacterium]|nr:benzoate/H(+) symporter BenE family transporter [Phototrophicaceae bacterium]